jgi:hypothetical protein
MDLTGHVISVSVRVVVQVGLNLRRRFKLEKTMYGSVFFLIFNFLPIVGIDNVLLGH